MALWAKLDFVLGKSKEHILSRGETSASLLGFASRVCEGMCVCVCVCVQVSVCLSPIENLCIYGISVPVCYDRNVFLHRLRIRCGENNF